MEGGNLIEEIVQNLEDDREDNEDYEKIEGLDHNTIESSNDATLNFNGNPDIISEEGVFTENVEEEVKIDDNEKNISGLDDHGIDEQGLKYYGSVYTTVPPSSQINDEHESEIPLDQLLPPDPHNHVYHSQGNQLVEEDSQLLEEEIPLDVLANSNNSTEQLTLDTTTITTTTEVSNLNPQSTKVTPKKTHINPTSDASTLFGNSNSELTSELTSSVFLQQASREENIETYDNSVIDNFEKVHFGGEYVVEDSVIEAFEPEPAQDVVESVSSQVVVESEVAAASEDQPQGVEADQNFGETSVVDQSPPIDAPIDNSTPYFVEEIQLVDADVSQNLDENAPLVTEKEQPIESSVEKQINESIAFNQGKEKSLQESILPIRPRTVADASSLFASAGDAANTFGDNDAHSNANNGVNQANKNPVVKETKIKRDVSDLFSSAPDLFAAPPPSNTQTPQFPNSAPVVQKKVIKSDASSLFGSEPSAPVTTKAVPVTVSGDLFPTSNSIESTVMPKKGHSRASSLEDASNLFTNSSNDLFSQSIKVQPAINNSAASLFDQQPTGHIRVQSDGSGSQQGSKKPVANVGVDSLFGRSDSSHDLFASGPSQSHDPPTQPPPQPYQVQRNSSKPQLSPVITDSSTTDFFGNTAHGSHAPVPTIHNHVNGLPPVPHNTPAAQNAGSFFSSEPPTPSATSGDFFGNSLITNDPPTNQSAPSNFFSTQPPNSNPSGEIFGNPPPRGSSTTNTPVNQDVGNFFSSQPPTPNLSTASTGDFFQQVQSDSKPQEPIQQPPAPTNVFENAPPAAPGSFNQVPVHLQSTTISRASSVNSVSTADSFFNETTSSVTIKTSVIDTNTSTNAVEVFNSPTNSASNAFTNPPPAPSTTEQVAKNSPAVPNHVSKTNSAVIPQKTKPIPTQTVPFPATSTKSVGGKSSLPDSLFTATADIFGASPDDPFASGPPGSSNNTSLKTSSADLVFSRAAPQPVSNNNVVPAPPSIKGVQYVAPSVAKPSVEPALPPVVNPPTHTQTKSKSSKPATVVPEGYILTPHGIVPINQSSNPSSSSQQQQPGASHQSASQGFPKVDDSHAPTVPNYQKVPPTQPVRQRPSGPYTPAIGPIATFGFGGKLCVMFPGHANQASHSNPMLQNPSQFNQKQAPGKLRIYKTIDLINQTVTNRFGKQLIAEGTSFSTHPNIVGYEGLHTWEIKHLFDLINWNISSSKKEEELLGALERRTIDLTSTIVNQLTSSKKVACGSGSSELLLWNILKIMIKHLGILHSEDDIALNAHAPENEIIQLLLHPPSPHHHSEGVPGVPTSNDHQVEVSRQHFLKHLSHYSASSNNNNNNNSSSTSDAISTCFVSIEQLLMQGKREEAVEMALSSEQWALAIMISSVCGSDRYKHTIRSYAERHFPKQSTMHLISLIYSGQAENHILHGGKSFAVPSTTTNPGLGGLPQVSHEWKKQLASILSNKVGEWPKLVQMLGDRVYSEHGDVMAQHLCMLCSGALPTRYGKFSLIGVKEDADTNNSHNSQPGGSHQGKDAHTHHHRRLQMNDIISLTALRMSEVIEWCILRNSQQSDKSASSTGSTVSSITSFFGLGKTSEASSTPESTVKESKKVVKFPPEVVMKVRAALARHKLKVAYLLTDLGLDSAALQVALEVREVAELANSQANQPSNTPAHNVKAPPPKAGEASKDGPTTPKLPFSRGFLKLVAELIDRLQGGHSHADGGDARTSNTSSKQQSNASTSSKSIWGFDNVLNVVKDLVDTGGPPPTSSQPPIDRGSKDFKGAKPSSGGQQGHGQPYPPSNKTLTPPPSTYNQYNQPPLQNQPGSSLPKSNSLNDISKPPPLTTPSPYGTVPPSMDYRGASQNQPPISSTNASKPMIPQQPSVSTNNSNMPPLQESKKTPKGASTPSKSPAKEASTTKTESSSGIVGVVKKGLMGWLYPEAHDASSNMGNSLEAYFDDKTGKWVFPGDDPSQPANPADLPPPTTIPYNKPGDQPPLNQSGPPSTSNNAPSDAYDPLAAMMAPPSRVYGSAPPSNLSSNDPLMSMMAPPPVRIPSVSSMSTLQTTGQGATNAAAGPPKTNQFNIWKPPSSSTLTSSAPTSNGGVNIDDPTVQSSMDQPPPLQPAPQQYDFFNHAHLLPTQPTTTQQVNEPPPQSSQQDAYQYQQQGYYQNPNAYSHPESF